jgi:D-alanyl-D-alanine carboxypeptidase
VLAAAITGGLVDQSASASTPRFREPPTPSDQRVIPRSASSSAAPVGRVPPGDRPGIATADRGGVTADDGVLPGGVTVFDDRHPGVTNLDADLLAALRDAATDAARDGITIDVNSGWRSARYKDRILREAVSRYGSEREAARWVATATTSPHVAGKAVDLGPSHAISWLVDHGARYGLCRIYANEPWHYELRPAAVADGCPAMYADPTHDPRMQQ